MPAVISKEAATPLGDVRSADHIILRQGAAERVDFGRYLDAIAAAIAKGADVQWVE
jgi:hypothetical protein